MPPIKKNFYYLKNIMTASEYNFYLKLKEREKDYIIHPQLNLASIVMKKSTERYASELFRNIDFSIFDKNYNLKILIELNDSSHNKIYRKERDLKVKNICNEINVPLITFYTNYPNEKDYVINRVLQEINNKNANKSITPIQI